MTVLESSSAKLQTQCSRTVGAVHAMLLMLHRLRLLPPNKPSIKS